MEEYDKNNEFGEGEEKTPHFRLRLEASIKNGILKDAREKLHLSQAKVAHVIGISAGVYGCIERMQYYPNEKTRQQIVDFYSLSGIPMKEEEAFPEQLKELKLQNVYVARRNISPLQLESIVEQKNLLVDSVEETIEKQGLKTTIDMALSHLNKNDADIVRMYFGLQPYEKEYTTAEIAQKMNLTGARVLQIQHSAIRKIRQLSNMKDLKIYLG